MTRILFVCLGNICRSPAAEGVMRSLLPDAALDSAGTSNWHIGDPPYGPMIAAAKARGYDLTPLKARQLTAIDFDQFDLILAMDRNNFADLESVRPQGNTTKVHFLTDFIPGSEGRDVPDPYYTRDFEGTLDLIEQACAGVLAHLTS